MTHVMEYGIQGNLSNKDGVAYMFDFGNRLRSVSGKESYRYDGHGRRVQATSTAGLGDILSQYGKDGVLRYQQDFRRDVVFNHVYLAGSLIATRETVMGTSTNIIKYQHTDALGSPVVVTDAGGNVIERSKFEPYGLLINRPLQNGPGYTGHVSDKETGLSYMQQRYYDPSFGRFLSVDPVTANANSGARFNRYQYAANNPYRFVDPDGRHERQGWEWPGYGASTYKQATFNNDTPANTKSVNTSVTRIDKWNAVQDTKRAEEQRWNTRELHGNEAAAARKARPDVDVSKIRIGYAKLVGAMTPQNVLWMPYRNFPRGPCDDLTTCDGGSKEAWFIHEISHVAQWQNNFYFGPTMGHILSSDIFTFSDYLTRDEFEKLSTPDGLNTEQEADWYMHKYMAEKERK